MQHARKVSVSQIAFWIVDVTRAGQQPPSINTIMRRFNVSEERAIKALARSKVRVSQR